MADDQPKTILMFRDPGQGWLAPHSAEVNENAIAEYRAGGFVPRDEVTWELPHPELPLNAGNETGGEQKPPAPPAWS